MVAAQSNQRASGLSPRKIVWSRSGPIEITLTWAPQRIVWIAIGLSAIALLVSLGLIAVAWFRRKRVLAANDDEAGPELASWRAYRGATPSPLVVTVVTVVSGVVMWFLAGIVVGGLAALTVLAGLLWPKVRPAVIALAPGALALAALFIIAKQWRYSLEPSFEWPTFFDKVHVLGWIGVSTLVADLVIREVRSRVVASAISDESTELSSSLPQEESRTIES